MPRWITITTLGLSLLAVGGALFRGAAIADRLTVPVLARAWQMLLKGVGEVESAPDRRAAAEMVLIRLCHVSEMPSPGELVRRLPQPG